MIRNYQHITAVLLLLIISSTSFAQPKPSEIRPPGYIAEQRKLKNWWDEPKAVTALKLETEQVAELAKLHEVFSTGHKASSKALKEMNISLGEAIVAGDEVKVSSIKKNMVEMMSANAVSQLEYKISGLAILSKQQISVLAASYPEVLDKKWGLRTKGMTKSKNKRSRGARLQKPKKMEADSNNKVTPVKE